MALVTARGRGFEIDEGNLQRQVEFTAKFLETNRTNYLSGKGQGGAALTAAYALRVEKAHFEPENCFTEGREGEAQRNSGLKG